MKRNDLFLLTIESANSKMYESYMIKPVFDLLSRSGLEVNKKNIKIFYDKSDQCIKMVCQDEILLSSYKPTVEQLRQRMSVAGFKEVILELYDDLNMIAALYRIE